MDQAARTLWNARLPASDQENAQTTIAAPHFCV
jgi:hypothetical protein